MLGLQQSDQTAVKLPPARATARPRFLSLEVNMDDDPQLFYAGSLSFLARLLLFFCRPYACRKNGLICVYKTLWGRRYLIDAYRPRGK
jgi:hypothetical protein